MNRNRYGAVFGVILAAAALPSARAQRPYLGFAYPAGGRQGTTFTNRLGGQGLDGVYAIHVSGTGVTARVVEYRWPLGPQDSRLLNEQVNDLRKDRGGSSAASDLLARIRDRLANYVNQPACRSIAGLAIVEITIAPDAPPGERELRAITPRGPTNPLAFDVGQAPETTRPPMKTTPKQLLGKESLALRKRPAEEVEVRITPPCAMNGQIASGEVNRYRFSARKGQRLVISLRARQLLPYIADAVPGWFQPVMALHDAQGREVAYADDYRFRPDPVILCEVPRDGEYVLTVQDSIFRGREDFVYRVTVGELPFVTSIFPLGGRAGEKPAIRMSGWNLDGAEMTAPSECPRGGIAQVVASRKGWVSNPMPFAVDTLPEILDDEAGASSSRARKITLPVIVNGRIGSAGDWDVYEFNGKAGETVVAEVQARRLDSPLDSVLKLTDAAGRLVALNDDCEDLATGLNTHHADSYVMARLPADGVYQVHIGDTARKGGEEYGYRLRISPPRPDFALFIVPSAAMVRGREGGSVSVYGVRKDGFSGPIALGLKDPPAGFSSRSATLAGTQTVTRFSFAATPATADHLVNLRIEGRAKVGETEIVREAVPAEDRMQAFLWRHFVPAQEFSVLPYPSGPRLLARRVPPSPPPAAAAPATNATARTSTSKFTKSQVAGRLRQLKRIYEDGLFTDEFYLARVAECERDQQTP